MGHVGSWDVAEFQTVPAILGICHPTGYPLYTLLGKLWITFFALGSVAWRMNVLSTVCTALAAGVLAGICRFYAPLPVAMAAGLTYAFSFYQWTVASQADPHSLNALFAGLIVASALAWEYKPGPRTLRTLALVCGLALANHLLTVMLLPAVALILLFRPFERDGDPPERPRLGLKDAAVSLGLFALGLSLYAYLPIRAAMHPPLDYAHPTTLARFVYLVTGQQFQGGMGFLSLAGIRNFGAQLRLYPGVLADWYLPAGAWAIGLLATGGLILTVVRRPRVAVFLYTAFLVPLYAAENYQNAELFRYFFPSHLVLLVLAAIGAGGLLTWVGRVRPLAFVLALSCIALPVAEARATLPRIQASLSSDRSEQFMDAVYQSAPRNAVILSWWDSSTTLWYGRWVLGMRPDLEIVDDRNLFDDGWKGDFLNVVHAYLGKRPIVTLYLEHDLARLRAAGYRLVDFSNPSYGHLGYLVEAGK